MTSNSLHKGQTSSFPMSKYLKLVGRMLNALTPYVLGIGIVPPGNGMLTLDDRFPTSPTLQWLFPVLRIPIYDSGCTPFPEL